MNRREMIRNASALAGVTVASGAFGAVGLPRRARALRHSSLMSELTTGLSECIAWCNKCEQHCIEMVSQGKTEFAVTLAKVRECADMCNAMLTYSTSNSQFVADVAKVCGAICRDCAAACNIHAAYSEICRDCAKACEHCAEQCEAVAAR